MPTQLVTSTSNTALAYSPTRKVETLCDGSLAVLDYDGTNVHLYQVTSPYSAPSTTSVQTFTPSGTAPIIASMHVENTGSTSSDVWIVFGANSSSAGTLKVAHGTYTAAGSVWSFDNTGTSVGLTGYQFVIPTITWTGTTLIVGGRMNNGTSYGFYIVATATKNGSSGWSAGVLLSSTSGAGTTHYFGRLMHDSTNGCTVVVYSLNGDTVQSRVIADASSPTTVANWSAEVALSGTVGVGAGNITAVIDPANKNLHVAWCNSSASPNPAYVKSTYTASSISAGTAFTITGGSGTGAIAPAIGLDGLAAPTVYLAWATAAAASASDIEYCTITSPYGSAQASAVTNLTNNTANDNSYPQMPAVPFNSGHVPLLYQFTAVSPFAIELDTSIASGVALAVSDSAAGRDRSGQNTSAIATSAGTGGFLLYPTNTNQVAYLPDGSLIFILNQGTNLTLYQIKNPGATVPAASSVQTFTLAGITAASIMSGDVFVQANSNGSADVWVAYAENNNTGGSGLQHGTYSAAGAWSWDAAVSLNFNASVAAAVDQASVAWTGTYLIVARRASVGGFVGVFMNYTTDKTGATGWQANLIQLSGSVGGSSHYFASLMHDTALGCTVAVYTVNGDTLQSRVLPDSSTPALANWGAQTALGTGTGSFDNFQGASTFLDHATGRVHVAYSSGIAGMNAPGYVSGTITVNGTLSAVSWGTPIAVGVQANGSNASPSLTVDGAGTVYMLWNNHYPNNTASDVFYAMIPAPYTAALPQVQYTSGTDHVQMQVPKRDRVNGFIPLFYWTGTVAPFTVIYDTSIIAAIAPSDSAVGSDALSITAAIPVADSAAGSDSASKAVISDYDAAIIREPNLIAYWPMDDAGSTAADLTGNGHTLTLAAGVSTGAASLLPLDSEAAMTWSGSVTTESAVAIPSSFAITTPAVEFWIDLASLPASNINIHWFRAGEFPNGGFGVGVRGSAWLFTTFTHADNVFSSGPTVGTRYYVVFKRDVSGNCSLYVNGALVQTLTGVGITAFADVVGIGGMLSDNALLDGTIQKIAVYSDITAGQIEAHWLLGSPIADGATGSDSVSVATGGPAQVSVSDSAAGQAEGISILAAIPAAEGATGSDAVSIAASAAIADTAAGGAEIVGITAGIPIGDPGAGGEGLGITASIPVGDPGAGSDTPTITAAIPVFDTPYAALVRADGAIAQYRLGDPVGSNTAADSSGNGNAATVNAGVTFGAAGLVSNDPDTAAQFAAGGSGITVPAAVAAAMAASASGMAIEAVVNLPATISTHGAIIGLRNETSADFYILQLQSGTSLEVRFRNSTGTAFTGSPAVSTGVRLHLILSYDKANLTAYVNGQPVFTTPASGVLSANPNDAKVGNDQNGNSFANVIDEAAFYAGPLSAAQAAAHYAALQGSAVGTDAAANDTAAQYAISDGSTGAEAVYITVAPIFFGASITGAAGTPGPVIAAAAGTQQTITGTERDSSEPIITGTVRA